MSVFWGRPCFMQQCSSVPDEADDAGDHPDEAAAAARRRRGDVRLTVRARSVRRIGAKAVVDHHRPRLRYHHRSSRVLSHCNNIQQ